MTDLDASSIQASLHTERMGRALEVLPRCASTNDEAARRARADAPEGLVVVADAQDGGRGRQGRAWFSPPGMNLYLSLLLRPGTPAWTVPPLTLVTGGVLAQVLADLGIEARLKWPNDVLLPTSRGTRKVAGILTEMATERDRVRHVVVGIGLNVNGDRFPPELEGIATSLRLVSGRHIDRGALLAAFLDAFEPAYDRYVSDGPADGIARFRSFARLGERCRLEREGDIIEGVTLDVDADGALRVRDDAGQVHRVVSGEVHTMPDAVAPAV